MVKDEFRPDVGRKLFTQHQAELELNLPLEPRQAMLFINLIANEVAEKGKRYCSGDREDDVFNLPCYLFEAAPIRPSRDNDRVLRILFCDPAGK